MTRDLETIVELQQALDELALAERRLDSIPDWMSELHDEHSAARREIEDLDLVAEAAAQDRRAAEAEIADAQERLKRYQQQIAQVGTQREYGALLKEIDTVKEQVNGLENRALAALEQREGAIQQLTERRETFRELDQRYGLELAKWEEEKPEVAKAIEILEGRISALRERLSPAVLSEFDRTFSRHQGRALAPVLRAERNQMWHCSACNYRVRPQVVVEIHASGRLVHCESCKRILFLETVEL